MRTRLQSRRQAGFTLIELMLAIAIVLVLAAILVVAVYKALGTTKQVNTANDIQQLALAFENFKTQYGFYPPSQIKLCERFSDYPTGASATQLDTDSIAYLTKMFPKITDSTNGPWMGTASPGFIGWNGDTTYTGAKMVLEGDQCLTFFLGGMPAPLNPTTTLPPPPTTPAGQYYTQTFAMAGFSQYPYNPWIARQQGEVRISFFDFTSYAK